jgi:hypothetical protein
MEGDAVMRNNSMEYGGNNASDRQAGDSDVVQKSCAETPSPIGTPCDIPVTGGTPFSQKQIIRRCGRYLLTRDESGFSWVLTGRRGSVWYWHADTQQWTARGCAYRTPEEAQAGLEETLAQEQAGDLPR